MERRTCLSERRSRPSERRTFPPTRAVLGRGRHSLGEGARSAGLALFASAILSIVPVVADGQQSAATAGTFRSQVQAYLDDWRAQATFPGASVGIVRADGSALGFVTGVADRATKAPLRETDLMLAGSTGKTFFAAVAVQLIEEGKLDLDAPISRFLASRSWFPRLPNAASITVRHLMTHTSGLVRYEMNPAFTRDLRAQPSKVWTPDEQIAYLLDSTPPFAAGAGWDYSDTNYIVLGMILEQITGTKLYDEVRRRFLAPLGLTRIVPSDRRRIPGLVMGYAGPSDPLGLPDEVIVNGDFVINPQFEWTGGGYATSALDLARWGHALYTARAISPAALKLMVGAAVPARLGPGVRYGLGVMIRPASPLGPSWGHQGFFPGYQTELVHFVDAKLTMAIQINSSAPRSTGPRGLLRGLYDMAPLVPSSSTH
jgi:D-alanyl-D-alanine carboxypeptidase